MEAKDSLWHVLAYLDARDLAKVKQGRRHAVSKDWKDRVEAMGLWRDLFSSVADSTRKYLTSLHGSQKQLRIRTVKPYRPAKMPDLPSSKPADEANSEPVAEHGKQWFVVPEAILERLKRATINKVAVFKKDAAFVDALTSLMTHWAEVIQKTVLQVTQSPLPTSALEEIAYWKDSERILGSVLNEINDVNVAKVDFILAGSAVHAKYLKELAGLKQACNQAKALSLHLSPLEKHIRKLSSFDGIALVVPSLIPSLESVQSCCPHLTRDRAVDLLGKISTMYAEDRVMDTLKTEVSVQLLAKASSAKGHEIVAKLQAIFEAFLRASLLEGEKRGVTAAPGPRSFSFRPASARVRTVPADVAMRKLFAGCLSVCQDLHRMIGIFDELKELCEHPDLGDAAQDTLRIYTDSKEVFDIFSPENTLQWDSLLQTLQERLTSVKRGPMPQAELEEEGDSDDELDTNIVQTQWKVC